MIRAIKPAALAAFILLSACSGGGPQLDAILSAPNATKLDATDESPFVLVDLGRSFAERLSASDPKFESYLPQSKAEPFVIGVSDVLDISIVSNNEEGFIDFSQSAIAPLSTTRLPQQQVATDGTVTVPQLGRVKASGRSVQSFETFLTRRLSEVLINPTAIVQMAQRQSATVSVVGRVAQGGTYPINLSTRRLLDVIGASGGPTADTEDLIVSLSRHGKKHQAALSDIYGNKVLNVYVRDGDLVSLDPRVTQVQVLGATGGNDVLTFEAREVSLIDVISEAGGLLAPRAARKGVFVYRHAPAHQLAALGADLSTFQTGYTIPTVFRIDLTRPDSLFTAKSFRMHDDDIVYVADSLGQQISDFFAPASNIAPVPAEYVRDAPIGN